MRKEAGLWEVFYGDTLVRPRMPNLTYMLSMPSLEEMNAKWAAFGPGAEAYFVFPDLRETVTST